MSVTVKRDKRLPVMLSQDEHCRVRIRAVVEQVAASDAARRLLMAWVRGEIDLPPEGEDGVLLV